MASNKKSEAAPKAAAPKKSRTLHISPNTRGKVVECQVSETEEKKGE